MKYNSFITFLFLSLVVISTSNGQSAIGLSANSLNDSLGAPMDWSTGSVVLLVDTAGDGFSPLTTSTQLKQGGFIDMIDSVVDDIIITESFGRAIFPGQFGGSQQLSKTFIDQPSSERPEISLAIGNAPIAMLWLPDVSSGSLNTVQLSLGTSYGIYSPVSYDLGSLASSSFDPLSIGAGTITGDALTFWSFPGHGANNGWNLTYTDSDAFGATAGSVDSIYGVARFEVSAIPEPSTYAALLGAVGLVYVGYRRRKNKAAA